MTKILSSAERGPWIAAHLALHYAVLNERRARIRYIHERRDKAKRQVPPVGVGETFALLQLNEARTCLGLPAFEFHNAPLDVEVFHHEFVKSALQTGRILRQLETQIVAGEFYADDGQSAIAAA